MKQRDLAVKIPNGMIGRMAIPSSRAVFGYPNIKKAHSVLCDYFNSLSEREFLDNHRNVIYATTVNVCSEHAYPDRFIYYAEKLFHGEVSRELSLLHRMGASAQAIEHVSRITDREERPSFIYGLGESRNSLRETVYNANFSILEKKYLEDVQLFEMLVGWGFDFKDGSISGLKTYTYITRSSQAAFQDWLVRQWNILLSPHMERLNPEFYFVRRYSADGRLSSLKIEANVLKKETPEIVKEVEIVLSNTPCSISGLPWGQVTMFHIALDYALGGDFEKCAAYYYYPHTPDN